MADQQILATRAMLMCLPGAMSVGVLAMAAAEFTAAASVGNGPKPPKPYLFGYGFGASDQGHTSGHSSGAGRASAGSKKSHAVPPSDVCGSWKFGIQNCDFPDLPGSKTPAARAARAAADAWHRLRLPVPKIATAPPRGSNGLVGLPEWFWVTNWSPHSDRVKAGRAWAELTARPSSLTINPGQGQPVVSCNGPGVPYSRSVPADAQHTDCSFTYHRSSAGLPDDAYRVTVTVRWGGSWRGSGGAGGTLPAVSRSVSFGLRVAEGQAVTGG